MYNKIYTYVYLLTNITTIFRIFQMEVFNTYLTAPQQPPPNNTLLKGGCYIDVAYSQMKKPQSNIQCD